MLVSNTFVTQNVNTCPLSVLNLKLKRYDGFVLHPLQVFKNIYLCRQTLTWKGFSRLKIRAFLVQYTSMMMHRAKTTNDVLYICNLNAVKFKVMSNLWRSMNFLGVFGGFFWIIYFSFKVYFLFLVFLRIDILIFQFHVLC